MYQVQTYQWARGKWRVFQSCATMDIARSVCQVLVSENRVHKDNIRVKHTKTGEYVAWERT